MAVPERSSDRFYLSSTIRGCFIEKKSWNQRQKLSNQFHLARIPRATQEFEASNCSGSERTVREFGGYAISAGINPTQIVYENVRICNRQRQNSRTALISRRRRSPSCLERAPRSLRARRRVISFLALSPRYVSIASAMTEEKPFSPRRAASSSSLALCSGLSSIVVRMSPLYMHVHACRAVAHFASALRFLPKGK